MGHGLVAAVCAELGVQVAHMGRDGVRRYVQLVGDLACRKVSRQVAQDADLAFSERIGQGLRPGGRCGWRAWTGEQAEELGDQRGVRAAAKVQQVPIERCCGVPDETHLTLREVRRVAFRKLEYAHDAVPFIVC